MRTTLEKYRRITQIQEQYAEQLKELAVKQIQIQQKVYKELKVDHLYEYRDVMRYDSMKIDSDGNVELWEYDRCDRRDSFLTTVYINDKVVKGDLEGYEQYIRGQCKAQAEQVQIATQKEAEQKRQRLEKELIRISAELGKTLT